MGVKIQIVTIGSELVSGRTVNSNAAFIGCCLQKAGYGVQKQLVLNDGDIKKSLQEAFSSSDAVIATGGLGPTLDDNTKSAVAEIFNRPLVIDRKWKQELLKRGLKSPFLENQASVIKDALVLPNRLGTACGMILKKQRKFLILLPGVPAEMKQLFEEEVLGFLKRRFPLQEKICQQELNLCLLKETDVAGFLEELKNNEPRIDIGIYPEHAVLKIVFTYRGLAGKTAGAKISGQIKKLQKKFSAHVFKSQDGLGGAVRDLLIKKQKTLAVAESCTGGALSAFLTRLPKASEYFLGGFIVYHNTLKSSLLQVEQATLKKYGAVSSQTVGEMLAGLFAKTKADFGIAVSGIAGPGGGTKKKPVGTVFIALGQRKKRPEILKLNLPNDRSEVINFSVSFALSRLLVKIKEL